MDLEIYQKLLEEYAEGLLRAAEVIPSLIENEGKNSTLRAINKIIELECLPTIDELIEFKKRKEERKSTSL